MAALFPWVGAGGGVFRLSDFAETVGWKVDGAFARGRCPVCDSSDGGWGTVLAHGRVHVDCWSCCDWKGIRDRFGLDGERGGFEPRFVPAPAPPSRAPALDMEADGAALDAVYRCFIQHLALPTGRRYEELARMRRIPDALRGRIAPLLSPPAPGSDQARSLVAALRQTAPDAILRRVPELAARRGNSYAVLHTHGAATYLEPWTDEHGRIVALRGYYRGGKPKYKATKGRTGPLVHVATGVARDQMANVPWLLTEGWMKAEVAAHALGVVAIAFPGVTAKGSWRRALRIKQRLAPDAPTYIAYDAEVWTTRPDIASLAFELAREVRWTEGRCAGFAAWDADIREEQAEPKGIDDAIVAGREIHLVDRLGFGAYLAPAFERWDRRVAA